MSVSRVELPESLDAAGLARLAAAIETAIGDASAVIVLEGRRETFCRGMDLASYLSESDIARGVGDYARCVRAVRAAPKPVIAVVEGVALGGGVGLAAAADIVIASPHATFTLPETLFGFVPAVVLATLLDRMPVQKARMLALSPHARTAAEAERAGLVDVIAEDCAAAVRKTVRELVRGRAGAGAVKRIASELAPLPYETAVARGVEETSQLLRTPRVAAAVRAFIETGEAPWLTE